MRIFSVKRLTEKRWVQKTVGVAAAEYLRFVWNSIDFVTEPPDIYERMEKELPIILTMWHGQHFLAPFLRPPQYRAKVLISRHRDGEINAIAAERLGIGTIRGSGDHGGQFARKGGVGAFREMLTALEQGYSVATTADVPKVARVAGLGIVKLAQISGRLIVPAAIATRHRIELDTWDRSVVHLPFGRGAGVAGELIRVAADADDARLEAARRAVEDSLNFATKRAYEIVDSDGGHRAGT
ncbi:MAG TPA: lysophospholipid acyltransferase family protein [Xanthobacteraceae bacterium]|nr:lysophospholipid acyltransferase family protein [Xanthobacteraceae bacterium]